MVNPLTLNPLTAVAGVQGNKKRELHLCNSQIFVVSPEPEFLNEYEWIWMYYLGKMLNNSEI